MVQTSDRMRYFTIFQDKLHGLQDLIGCRKRRKLKAPIPRVVVFVNYPPPAERRIDFAVLFIVLWSYGRKICLNMCHGNSENSYGCSYLFRICFSYGTNVSVSRS